MLNLFQHLSRPRNIRRHAKRCGATVRFGVTLCMLLTLLGFHGHTAKGSSLLSELKMGPLLHDPFSHFVPNRVGVSESGFALNGELLFKSPGGRIFNFIFNPRPHIGLNLHTENHTHSTYAGLTWRLFNWDEIIFVNASFGGLIHSGATTKNRVGSVPLGTRLLFRESIEIGAMLTKRLSLSFILAHASNANIGKFNPGYNTLGFRFGCTL